MDESDEFQKWACVLYLLAFCVGWNCIAAVGLFYIDWCVPAHASVPLSTARSDGIPPGSDGVLCSCLLCEAPHCGGGGGGVGWCLFVCVYVCLCLRVCDAHNEWRLQL